MRLGQASMLGLLTLSAGCANPSYEELGSTAGPLVEEEGAFVDTYRDLVDDCLDGFVDCTLRGSSGRACMRPLRMCVDGGDPLLDDAITCEDDDDDVDEEIDEQRCRRERHRSYRVHGLDRRGRHYGHRHVRRHRHRHHHRHDAGTPEPPPEPAAPACRPGLDREELGEAVDACIDALRDCPELTSDPTECVPEARTCAIETLDAELVTLCMGELAYCQSSGRPAAECAQIQASCAAMSSP